MMYWFLIVMFFIMAQAAVPLQQVPEKGCPPPETIKPCECTHGPHPYLLCQNIDDTEALRNVFLQSSRYGYNEVHIEYSVLQYLPHDMFQGVRILELHLKNVTLVQLFDEPPENLQMMQVLHIENTHVFRGMSWDFLQNLTSIRILNIYYNSIPVLGWEFSEQVSKSLAQISFYDTQTEILQPGVLGDFVNLDKVAFDSCGITELTRNIFPKPFNGRFIYFNYNKLTSIPDDLFTEMPRLLTVSLRDNQIATIPAQAFDDTFYLMQHFMLEGNPLDCDCRIMWIIRQKPTHLTGKCKSPLSLEGRELKDFSLKDMICPLP